MRYVSVDGAVWSMSNANFRRLAADIKHSEEPDQPYVEHLDRYGTMITPRVIQLEDVVAAYEEDAAL